MRSTIFEVLHWYEYRSRWSNIRQIGKSPFARISILMPVFGYIILLNGQFLEYADIDQRFRLVSTDSPWRIVMFYYGSFFAGVATAIFTWKCPAIIQRYSSTVDFVNAETMFYSEPRHKVYLGDVLTDFASRIQNWKRQGYELESLTSDMRFEVKASPESLSRYLALFWHCRDYDKTPWRVATRFIFDISIVTLAVPASISLLGVTQYVVGLGLMG